MTLKRNIGRNNNGNDEGDHVSCFPSATDAALELSFSSGTSILNMINSRNGGQQLNYKKKKGLSCREAALRNAHRRALVTRNKNKHDFGKHIIDSDKIAAANIGRNGCSGCYKPREPHPLTVRNQKYLSTACHMKQTRIHHNIR
mmetsp:Transcript_19707/g.29919  ORF Transcript_19707/g.29919 Transcript_19707/m.29919 type:complete len:144 (+) Transcript_19707:3-434(+)